MHAYITGTARISVLLWENGTLRYVMYFRFCDDVTFDRIGPYDEAEFDVSMNTLLLLADSNCDISRKNNSVEIEMTIYRVAQKSKLYICDHNSGKTHSIFIIFELL